MEIVEKYKYWVDPNYITKTTHIDIDTIDYTKGHVTRKEIEKITNFRVKNLIHYQRALVHKSIEKVVRSLENTKIPEYMKKSNERLEFLGDAVINIVIAELLFKKFTENDEGFLTRIRTKLVNGKTLCYLSEKIGLDKYLLLSKNLINIKERSNKRILEDAFEAFIGAIYLDQGFNHAKTFTLNVFNNFINIDSILNDDNYKDILLRYTQNCENKSIPDYSILEESGPSHNKLFKIQVIINGKRCGIGMGKTKKEAEQKASQNTINILKIKY